ncbi:hypothetical protein [Candidatus Poriferisodalis sp.]|uniref:hypothetical protein n=1 Tax=Candidatus Poriferisodalis sp. TaxID=3101277 RepID=UPI003B01F6E7
MYADLEAEAAAAGLSPIDAELALQRFERSGSMRMGDDGTPLSARQPDRHPT